MLQPKDFGVRPLPVWLRVPNTIIQKTGLEAPHLTPENLTKAASRSADLPAKFPVYLETALDMLCRSLVDDAQLHWFGRMNYWNAVVTGLASFLQVEQAFRDDPALAQTRLLNPLIVTGLPRSGTTFLHRLLSSTENAKGVELYRLLYPVQEQPDLRKLKALTIFEPWRLASGVYKMDAIHYMRPSLTDECNFGLRLTMRSMLFGAMSPAYGYTNWLLEQDQQPAYDFYRKVVILFQRQMPEKRLTLKCPYHVGWLPNLASAFPEADIIQTHRDPLEAVASYTKLMLSIHGLATNALDVKKTAENAYSQMNLFAQRSVDFASTAQGKRVFHLKYPRLLKDQDALVADIYAFFGLSLSAADVQTIKEFSAENRQYKHGRNPYSLEQFGFSPEQIKQSFKRYRETFL
jgi:hypothetical protein